MNLDAGNQAKIETEKDKCKILILKNVEKIQFVLKVYVLQSCFLIKRGYLFKKIINTASSNTTTIANLPSLAATEHPLR